MGTDFYSNKHEQYDYYKDTMKLCSDAKEGEKVIKENGTAYLPKLMGMNEASTGDTLYGVYKDYAIWYPATGKTYNVYQGALFRKPINKTIPEQLKVEESFSFDGQSLSMFTKQVTGEMIVNYRPAVLVDFPSIDTSGMSQEDIDNNKIRPYAIMYKERDILNWHEENINGNKELKKVLLQERHSIYDHRYSQYVSKNTVCDGDNIIVRRLLELVYIKNDEGEIEKVYVQSVYIQKKKKDKNGKQVEDWAHVSTNTPLKDNKPLDFIPIVPITENGLLWSLDNPIIEDLARYNIADYRNEALYRNILLFVGRPTPCIAGYLDANGDSEQTTLSLGSSSFLQFSPDGKWGMLGGDAQSAAALQKESESMKKMLASIGSRGLASDPSGVESAETATIHRSDEHSTLSNIAIGASLGMRKVIEYMAWWADVDEDIVFEINNDFIPSTISPQLLQTLYAQYLNSHLPLSVFFYNLKKGEILPESMTEDEYREKLADAKETPSNNIVKIEGVEEL